MSMMFLSAEEARQHVMVGCGLDPNKDECEEILNLMIGGIEIGILEDPNTPKTMREDITRRVNDQKSYKLQTPKGEVLFSVAPFREGWCCWILTEKGFAIRL